MERLTTTPFGRRPATLGQIAAATRARATGNVRPADKWTVLRDLTTARGAYGLTDRDLVVLNALLSFHPGSDLSDPSRLIVFPSNASLSQRAHGMPESTLRRHLAALTASGLVLRHDSPNGKRYAARGSDGAIVRAFGFDLAPLLHRAAEIAAAAREAHTAALLLKRLREEVVLMLRDVLKLLPLGPGIRPAPDETEPQALLRRAQRTVRRKPHLPTLQSILAELSALRDNLQQALTAPMDTRDPSADDARNERHIQSQKPEESESDDPADEADTPAPHPVRDASRPISLALVRDACPDLEAFNGHPIRAWSQLLQAAGKVSALLRIPPDVWQEAEAAMGPADAAVTVACILQRAESIARPGAYLRTLSRLATGTGFTHAPMLHALARSPRGAVS